MITVWQPGYLKPLDRFMPSNREAKTEMEKYKYKERHTERDNERERERACDRKRETNSYSPVINLPNVVACFVVVAPPARP